MIPNYEKLHEHLQVTSITIPGGDFFPPHIHEETELHFTQMGQIEYTVGKQTVTSQTNDCVIIFPRQLHTGGCTEPAADCSILFHRNLADSFQDTLARFRPASPLLPAASLPEEVPLAFRKIQDYYTRKQFTLAHAWLQVLLANLIPLLTLEENKSPEDEALSFQIIYYLSEHFQEPLTLEQAAKELHINKFYLSHFFSANLHMILQYLTELRVEYAMNAIHSTRNTMTQIWQEAGFCSQQTFNRAFRAKTGMTPLEYRKNPQLHQVAPALHSEAFPNQILQS